MGVLGSKRASGLQIHHFCTGERIRIAEEGRRAGDGHGLDAFSALKWDSAMVLGAGPTIADLFGNL